MKGAKMTGKDGQITGNVKISGNGHKKPGAKAGVNEEKPLGQLPGFLTGGQLGGMTGGKEMPSALNMLADPGDAPRQLSMRTILGRKTPGRIMAIAFAYHLARLEEFGDVRNKEEILDMEALFVSDSGIGRIQLTEAITGERNHEEAKGGMGSWLQKMAWGNKKQQDGQ